MTNNGFFSRTSDRRGAKRQTAYGVTREIAIEKVFLLDPKAKTCSTSRAGRIPTGALIDASMDVRWHNRPRGKTGE